MSLILSGRWRRFEFQVFVNPLQTFDHFILHLRASYRVLQAAAHASYLIGRTADGIKHQGAIPIWQTACYYMTGVIGAPNIKLPRQDNATGLTGSYQSMCENRGRPVFDTTIQPQKLFIGVCRQYRRIVQPSLL